MVTLFFNLGITKARGNLEKTNRTVNRCLRPGFISRADISVSGYSIIFSVSIHPAQFRSCGAVSLHYEQPNEWQGVNNSRWRFGPLTGVEDHLSCRSTDPYSVGPRSVKGRREARGSLIMINCLEQAGMMRSRGEIQWRLFLSWTRLLCGVKLAGFEVSYCWGKFFDEVCLIGLI